jgi:hypothetical protein
MPRRMLLISGDPLNPNEKMRKEVMYGKVRSPAETCLECVC